MTTVSIWATPDIAKTLFDMAMNVPEHVYFTTPHETIRKAAINGMINCSRLNLTQVIDRAHALPGFTTNSQLIGAENEILKTLWLAHLLSSQKKENLIMFFKDIPLKANL